MPRGPCPFKQSALTRALRVAAKEGIEVGRFEIATDGRIIVVARSAMATNADGEKVEANPLDEWRSGRDPR